MRRLPGEYFRFLSRSRGDFGEDVDHEGTMLVFSHDALRIRGGVDAAYE